LRRRRARRRRRLVLSDRHPVRHCPHQDQGPDAPATQEHPSRCRPLLPRRRRAVGRRRSVPAARRWSLYESRVPRVEELLSLKASPAFFAAAAMTVAAAFVPSRSLAYQSFMTKAKKYGAKDCLFCHEHEDGGEGWNDRGRWLMEQKAKRGAEKIDVDWLA